MYKFIAPLPTTMKSNNNKMESWLKNEKNKMFSLIFASKIDWIEIAICLRFQVFSSSTLVFDCRIVRPDNKSSSKPSKKKIN